MAINARRLQLDLASCFLCLSIFAASSLAAGAEDKPLEVNFVTFPWPSMATIMTDTIIANGFDRANGIIAKPVTYGTAGALWAAVAKGELVAHNMGPYTLPQIRSEGVNIAIYSTLQLLSSEQIITRDPGVKKFEDLKGKKLAAMVGFPEYDYLQMYARKKGIEIADQMTVVNATPALARSQLEAGRVEAMMAWEPEATMILKANPDAHVILTGDEMWQALLGQDGWQGMNIINLDYAKEHPGLIEKLLKVHQQAGEWLNTHPDEADAMLTSNKYNSKGIVKGTIAEAIRSGHLHYDVRPAWDPATNKRIWDAFKLGLEFKTIKAMPPADAVIATAPQ